MSLIDPSKYNHILTVADCTDLAPYDMKNVLMRYLGRVFS